MPEIELKYFPLHGFRGLMPRLVMHLGDIPFTEKIIQVRDWSTVKSSKWFIEAHILENLLIFVATLLGYLPELKVDGVIYAQTIPIVNYLQKVIFLIAYFLDLIPDFLDW